MGTTCLISSGNLPPSLLTWVQTDIQQLILTGHCIKNKLKVKSLDITSHFIIEDLCLLCTSPLQNTSIYGQNENRSPPPFKLSQRTSYPLSSIRVCSAYDYHQDGGSKVRTEGSNGLGGAVVDQALSVLEGDRDGVDGYALVLWRLLPSLHEAVHQDA